MENIAARHHANVQKAKALAENHEWSHRTILAFVYHVTVTSDESANAAFAKLEKLRLKGPCVWNLYSKLCRENMECFAAIINAADSGEISHDDLFDSIFLSGSTPKIDVTRYM